MRKLTWLLLGVLIATGLGANAAIGGKLGEQTFNFLRAFAGERNEDSTTGTDYVNAAPETKCDTVDVATNSTTVYNGPARLYYYYVNTALSANTNIFKDNATSKFTLAQSLAVGSDKTFPGARFDTSLVFDPDDAATGNITVCYAPLDAGVTY